MPRSLAAQTSRTAAVAPRPMSAKRTVSMTLKLILAAKLFHDAQPMGGPECALAVPPALPPPPAPALPPAPELSPPPVVVPPPAPKEPPSLLPFVSLPPALGLDPPELVTPPIAPPTVVPPEALAVPPIVGEPPLPPADVSEAWSEQPSPPATSKTATTAAD